MLRVALHVAHGVEVRAGPVQHWCRSDGQVRRSQIEWVQVLQQSRAISCPFPMPPWSFSYITGGGVADDDDDTGAGARALPVGPRSQPASAAASYTMSGRTCPAARESLLDSAQHSDLP